MNRRIIALSTIALAACTLAACGPNKDKEIAAIEQQEHTLYEGDPILLDTVKGNTMVTLYEQYAADFATDSLTPIYLFRAADISYNMGHLSKAVALYQRLLTDYTNFSQIADCYFQIARCYEDSGEYKEAIHYYQEFVNLYPNHPLATDTKYLLDNKMVGLSPEEMLNRVQAANADQAN